MLDSGRHERVPPTPWVWRPRPTGVGGILDPNDPSRAVRLRRHRDGAHRRPLPRLHDAQDEPEVPDAEAKSPEVSQDGRHEVHGAPGLREGLHRAMRLRLAQVNDGQEVQGLASRAQRACRSSYQEPIL